MPPFWRRPFSYAAPVLAPPLFLRCPRARSPAYDPSRTIPRAQSPAHNPPRTIPRAQSPAHNPPRELLSECPLANPPYAAPFLTLPPRTIPRARYRQFLKIP